MNRKNQNLKYIILGDPFTSGHHELFLLMYAKLFVDLGYNVSIFSPKETTIWSDLPSRYKKHVSSYHLDTYMSVTFFKSFWANHLASTIYLWFITTLVVWKIAVTNRQFPTLVFFLWFDHYADPYIPAGLVDFFFPFAWSGLYFHPRHIREHMMNAKSRFYFPDRVLQSHHCKCVTVLDESIQVEMEKQIRTKPVIVMPDIIYTNKTDKHFWLYKEIKKRAGDRKIIGCLGSLEKRKSVLFLSHVAEHLRNDNYYFVFIGSLYKETFSPDELVLFEKFKNNPPDNCFIYPEGITDVQLNTIVRLCDVLFLGYVNFYHSSNILTKAGLFNKQSIVYDSNYCMAERTHTFRLGSVIKENNIRQCIHAIKNLTHTAYDNSYSDKLLHTRFRSQFSYINFKKSVKTLLSYYV